MFEIYLKSESNGIILRKKSWNYNVTKLKMNAGQNKSTLLGPAVVSFFRKSVDCFAIFIIIFLNDSLMPCPFIGPKMFCTGLNFLSQPKNLTAFSASSKTFVPAQKQFHWMQIIFLFGTKCLWLPQFVKEFLVWHKKFAPAQNIFGPVKWQGINP